MMISCEGMQQTIHIAIANGRSVYIIPNPAVQGVANSAAIRQKNVQSKRAIHSGRAHL